MGKVCDIVLQGISGRTYKFEVYPWGTQFKSLGAVYVVLRLDAPNFTVLYVGQTGDLSERFDYHHKRPCFDRNRKTHIGIYLESDERKRLGVEADLVAHYSPPCNY